MRDGTTNDDDAPPPPPSSRPRQTNRRRRRRRSQRQRQQCDGRRVVDDDHELWLSLFPAVQSIPSLLPAQAQLVVEYTETPQRRCTLGIPPTLILNNHTNNHTIDTNNTINNSGVWATAPIWLIQPSSSSSVVVSSSHSLLHNSCPNNIDWIVAATTDGMILFWKLDQLSSSHNDDDKAAAVVIQQAGIVPPTQQVKVVIHHHNSSNIAWSNEDSMDDLDTNDENQNDISIASSTLDRIIQLIYLDKMGILVAVTILGIVYELLAMEISNDNSDYNNNNNPEPLISWVVQRSYSLKREDDDDDVMNIRHVILWTKDNDFGTVIVVATDTHLMAWKTTMARTSTMHGTTTNTTTTTTTSNTTTANELLLLWKHAVEDISGMERLGNDFLVLSYPNHHHGQQHHIQVLDMAILLESQNNTLFDAIVLARPGYELVDSVTEQGPPTRLYRRARMQEEDDVVNSVVVITFANGLCVLLGIMMGRRTDDDDDGTTNVEWGVLSCCTTTTSMILPLPAVGIGTNRWGDILFCLPAGSTMVYDITGTRTAAWMLPIGRTGSGVEPEEEEEEDIMIPVQGFATSTNGFDCVYQWPNGIMDVFSVQRPAQQLLQALVDDGIALELVKWLCQKDQNDIVSTMVEDSHIRAQQELLLLDTIDCTMDELFVKAPSLRQCLLWLTK